jgi:putative ubiquitin-RnfH superfamily antitoxin RatB of RatAB toxin-antitoxin module
MLNIEVEVAYASPTKQILLKLQVKAGSNIKDVLLTANIIPKLQMLDPKFAAQFAGDSAVVLPKLAVGIFGKQKTLDTTVVTGDRIEIYRQLHLDPKEARRRRAQQQRKKK